VADDGGRVVAFRTFLRWEFARGGEVLRAVRAVDTATDPDYRGKGLFRALTLRAVDQLAGEGVAFVFNTPNDQSRPGYLRMGWRDVGRVPAAFSPRSPSSALRLVRARVPADRWSQVLETGEDIGGWVDRGGPTSYRDDARHVREIRTNVSEAYLRWRYGLAPLYYRVFDVGAAALVVRLRRRGASSELSVVEGFGSQRDADHFARRLLGDIGADYALRSGPASPAAGFVALPGGGPRLTWRALAEPGMPPLPNWRLSLGDLELF